VTCVRASRHPGHLPVPKSEPSALPSASEIRPHAARLRIMIARFVTVLLILGALLTGAGVMFGGNHVRRSGVDCGTAFPTLEPSRGTLGRAGVGGNTDFNALCDQPRSGRTSLVLALLVPGVALLLAGAGLGFALWSNKLGQAAAAGPNLRPADCPDR
jgi:hypothetical protein